MATERTPREVALSLLRDMGTVREADEIASRRSSRARREDSRRYWYEVGLEIHRLGHVRVREV
jgi:hypothetical protein